MTVTTTDMTNWLGLSVTLLPAATLTECLAMANEYVSGRLAALGVGTGGTAYDAAVRSMTAVFVWQNMDARAVKPNSFRAGDLTIASDVKGAIETFMSIAETQIYAAALSNASNKVDFFIHRNRGGQGV